MPQDTWPASSNGGLLWHTLERSLTETRGQTTRVTALQRRPCPYRTGFAIEELDVQIDDGPVLELIWKDLSPEALLPGTRAVKPAFLYDPLREIRTYAAILTPAALSTPHYYGAFTDQSQDRYWLFLERVGGPALWQVGGFEAWRAAACWLAQLHSRFVGDLASLAQAAPLLRYERTAYCMWLRRAQEYSTPAGQAALVAVVAHHDEIVAALDALPATLLHGEFYPSNILVGSTATGPRICPVDWEMAALGPGLLDLAAFLSGRWTEAQRAELAAAYYDAAVPVLRLGSWEAFLAALDLCRLQVAIQWLGWSPGWAPPADHVHDWANDIVQLTARLGR